MMHLRLAGVTGGPHPYWYSLSVVTCIAAVTALTGASDVRHKGGAGLEVAVEGTVEKQEGGLGFTRIVLRPMVTIDREQDRERAGRLLEKAERGCPMTRSILATFVLEPKIAVAAEADV